MREQTRVNLRAGWRVVWAARWTVAMFAYLCACTPSGIDWDWFVVTMN